MLVAGSMPFWLCMRKMDFRLSFLQILYILLNSNVLGFRKKKHILRISRKIIAVPLSNELFKRQQKKDLITII